MTMTLRPFRLFDLPGMYRVCLLTGDEGKDASNLYRNPDLLGHIYVGPYVKLEPELAFVLADDQGVAGYILGTANTAYFETWCERNWWPELRRQYPLEPPGGADGTGASLDRSRIVQLHHPPTESAEITSRYPAHLHIDILPRAQRGGWGRRLIETLAGALKDRGVPGLHLGVGAANQNGRAFYLRMGFTEQAVHVWGSTMVMDLRG